MTTRDLLSVLIEPDYDRNICVLTLAGSIDIATLDRLREALTSVPKSGCTDVILDMRAVDYIDSTGLGALIGAKKALSARDEQLKLVVGGGVIERLLQITGLVGKFPIYRTLDDAKVERSRVPSI